MFVLDFVQVLLRIARYYSIKNSTFHTKPVPSSKAKLAGFSDNEEFLINITDKMCNCKYFRKDAIFGHLLGLNSLLNNDNFVNKPKKGAQKKAKKVLIRD
ncbi:hypothetical protein BpHYR1_011808 [Brachionus plicatilis]|uniref:Uncharacterized protein n=1 Tax=Brachionus plicatilis TaxID=10195 RepID=A0A3M7PNS2_BRAPC|nr:hypothetical protein BpHYR1_011808 [Brachionus plicatilis]